MRFTAVIAGLAAISSAVAVPVETELLTKAKALVKRQRAGLPIGLSKRNNDGGSGGASGGITDVDILNFALQLEYLEAQYYHIAAYGTQLSQDLLGGKGKRGFVQNNAGQRVPFASDVVRQYAVEIATDEMNHVKALRAALGDAAVAQPEINLDTAFTAAARAAGVVGANDTFNPFSSDAAFIVGAFIFEDVGVTAYNGAAPLVQNKEFLAAAAGILAVEAYHAAAIRVNLFIAGQADPAVITNVNKVAAAVGSLGGGKSEGITKDGQANIIPADENSIAFARTPGEVASIVYLGGSTSGGFFPNGLNGPLNAGAASS